jgi:hypothetical protein
MSNKEVVLRTTVLSAVAALAAASALGVVSATRHDSVTLTSGEELVEMGGTGESVQPSNIFDVLAGAINGVYGTDFSTAAVSAIAGTNSWSNSNGLDLFTPEGIYNGTYHDDEIYLANGLIGNTPANVVDPADPITVFGVSQSAGAMGLLINDIADNTIPTQGIGAFTQNLAPGAETILSKEDIHWIALAPPTMDQHGNAAGLFTVPYPQGGNSPDGDLDYRLLYSDAADGQTFPTNAPNADVYCGMYDGVCDFPTTGNATAQTNSSDGINDIHDGYGSLTTNEFIYEMDHATNYTIGQGGSVNIIAPGGTAPAGETVFHLMPDVYNYGTGASPDYDSLLPDAYNSLWDKSFYEQFLPQNTLQVDAGYDDSLHPFEYMINNQDYTFAELNGSLQVVQVSPGEVLPAVTPAELSEFAPLAEQIASGAVSPIGLVDAADTVSSDWWSQLFGWL